ncbi:MAG TPA: SigB/SigF/SigG family RNA polymerase sigma factor [Candidatus Eremiobacteraceae bacterium]|nr:SigB/SigF/SigG family RNA polymerase sigma factor [Candidatus Eremiobacteraceae bacterium]
MSRSDKTEQRERIRERFAAFAVTRDEAIRDELVLEHVNLVRYLALKFANRGEPLDDLVQVGTVGLIKAVDRFEADRGVEFTTYATPTIVGEIKRYFRDKGWAVRVPRRLQELNLAVNRAVEELSIELGRSVTVSDLAARLGASEDDIIEAQELGQAYNLLSLDAEVGSESDGRSATLAEYVGATDPQLEAAEVKLLLEESFGVLDGRERIVVYLRYYQGMAQTDIARRLQVSQMHVSRLQARAVAKLKASLKVG